MPDDNAPPKVPFGLRPFRLALVASFGLHLAGFAGAHLWMLRSTTESEHARQPQIHARLTRMNTPDNESPREVPIPKKASPNDLDPVPEKPTVAPRPETSPGKAPSEPAAHEKTETELAQSDYRPPSIIGDGPKEIALPEGMIGEGELSVEISVDREGRPIAVRRLRSSLPPPLENLVIQQFLRASYRPALRNGIPEAGTLEIAIRVDSPN